MRFLVFAAALGLAAVSVQAATSDAVPVDKAKGEALFTAQCVACHGADGNSATPAYPKLAGQHAAYLEKQLKQFQSGERANAIMKGMAGPLSADDIRNVAAWLTTQKPKLGFAKNKDTLAMGERIYRGGIADRQIPACASCHSPTGAGIPAQYPRLSGQHADYIAAQLTAFRDGVRKNNAPMQAVTAKMNDREIKAVADYIAGLR